MITQALLVRLEARHRREEELERYLYALSPLVEQEACTPAWFALRSGFREFAAFAAFPGVDARESHLAGAVVRSLRGQADFLLACQPRFQRCAVLAGKLPPAAPKDLPTKALLLSFKAKAGHADDLAQFLRDAKVTVMQEARTYAWFALMLDDGSYGSFSVFPDQGARFLHLTGRMPRALAKHSFSLLGSMPELDMMGVLATALPRLKQA